MNANEAINLISEVLSRYKGKRPVADALEVIRANIRSGARGTRQGSITNSMYELFEVHGIDEVNLDMAIEAARAAKPDTAFDKTHLAYHKTQYRKANLMETSVK